MTVKPIDLPGDQHEHAHHPTLVVQGNGGHRAPANLAPDRMPGRQGRRGQKVLQPDRPVFTNRPAHAALAKRAVRVGRDLDPLQALDAAAKRRHRQHPLGGLVAQADPGHLHAAQRHRRLANPRKQLLARTALHDGLIAFAQGGIELGLALALQFRPAPLRDVLQHHDAARTGWIGLGQDAPMQADGGLRAIAAANVPLGHIVVNLATYQTLEPSHIKRSILRADQVQPTQAVQLFAGVAGDGAKMIVDPAPARPGQVAGGNSNEGQGEETRHQLIGLGLRRQHLQPLSAPSLAPQQGQYRRDGQQGQRGDPADPQGQHPNRRHHLGAVHLGHHAPGRARHGPVSGHDLDAPVVKPGHDIGQIGAQGNRLRQAQVGHRQTQFHGCAAAVSKRIHEDGAIPLARDQQGLATRAGRGPGLNHRKQKMLRRAVHQHQGLQAAQRPA